MRIRPTVQDLCRPANLRLEAKHGRIAGENEVIDATRQHIIHEPRHDLVGFGKPRRSAQNAIVEPGGEAFGKPVVQLPLEPRRDQMDIAEMGQANHAAASIKGLAFGRN